MRARSSRGVPFHRLHAVITYAISGLGLFALTRGQQIGIGGASVLFAGYLASVIGGSSRPKAAADLSGRTNLWNGIMIGAVLLQVARYFLSGEAILSLAFELAGALQIAKLFNRHTARDHQQIQALAFLHLIGASVLTSGLDYALIFFGFVVLTPWMLALTQMRVEIERHYGGSPAEDDQPATDLEQARASAAAIARVLRSRRIAGSGFLLGTAALALPLFLVTAGFFLLFPRVGLGFLSFGGEAAQQVAGFGGNVELGDFGVIRDDPTVVLRVTPSDLGDNPPAERSFRLRGTSFDDYREARWTRTHARSERLRGEYSGWTPLRPRAASSDANLELEFVLDPLGERVVFLPSGTIGMRSPARVEAGIDRQREFTIRRGREIRYGESDGLPLRYTAYVDDSAPELHDPLEQDQVEAYLQLPQGQERVAALAEEIAGNGSSAERAKRLERWLRDSGELSYTLRLPDTAGADPLEVFLFEAKQGHCEYFSTALAVMLRTQGIPARNVTGFVGGVYNEYGNYYAIRQGDAHSWVEAWVDDRWVTFDPTPAARAMPLMDDGWLAEIRAAIDAMRTRWSRDVVGYDLRDQVDGVMRFIRFLRSFRESEPRGLNPNGPRAAESEQGMSSWPIALAALAVLVLLVWWFRRSRRSDRQSKRRGRQKPSPSAREATRLYRQLDKQLRSIGFPRAASTTPKEHAQALRDEDIHGQEVIEAITEAYLAARYAGVPMDAGSRRMLERKLGSIVAKSER